MKENNNINLEFDKTMASLAGNDFGYENYKKQIKDKFNYEKNNVIIFPEHIKKIAISFIQGMFRDILEKVDKNEIEEYVTIKASTPQLIQKVLTNIKF